MADLADIGLEWDIQQARDGKRGQLARNIKRWKGPMPSKLLDFLCRRYFWRHQTQAPQENGWSLSQLART